MNISDLVFHLPEEPPKKMQEWARSFNDNVGGNHLLLFRRESIEIVPELKRTMSDSDWEERERKTVRRWGAVCTCTACQEEFEAGWCSYSNARVKGIRITMGEQGFWPGYVEPGSEDSIEVAEGDTLICPFCECEVRLLALSSISDTRTWQMLLGDVEVIGGYTVILTWLYRRRLHKAGFFEEDIRPARAIAITKRGGLHRFDHVRANSYGGTYDLPQWVDTKKEVDDPFLMLYYNYDAINQKQVGGAMWTKVPDLCGSTGEKTGLAEYVKRGGGWPVAYLKEWQRRPNIENLVKSGFGGRLVDDIDSQINNRLSYGNRGDRINIEWANLSESRPTRMLGMTKPELDRLSKKWTIIKLEEWYRYWYRSADVSATVFDQWMDQIGLDAVQTINAYGAELSDEQWVEKAIRYTKKQKGMTAKVAAELLCDLWDMLKEESEGRIIEEEELWPRDLRAAHDRLAEGRDVRRDAKAAATLLAGFKAIRSKYGELEWTDGELCIRLPRNNDELKKEGAILRHCVGGYGKGHTEERSVVFFIRRYRRPERSYYTTDYDLRQQPMRNQLHGYGNEMHGEHKQYRHSIPKKVTDFLERWEREVLRPWYHKHITAASNKRTKRRSA